MRIRWTAGLDSCTAYKQNCGDAWGEHGPGMEIPVQAKEVCSRQIRCISRKRDAERNKVAKHVSPVPRKAAIALYVPVP